MKDDELVAAVKKDYTTAKLSRVNRALCDFAMKLTRTPAQVDLADIQRLRDEGLDDLAIHDAVQVVSYFNYINRVADGLNVDLEPEMKQ